MKCQTETCSDERFPPTSCLESWKTNSYTSLAILDRVVQYLLCPGDLCTPLHSPTESTPGLQKHLVTLEIVGGKNLEGFHIFQFPAFLYRFMVSINIEQIHIIICNFSSLKNLTLIKQIVQQCSA